MRRGLFAALALYACVVLLPSAAALLESLRFPIMGEHEWRNADTFATMVSFAHEDARPWLPRIFWRNELSGVMGMEAPVYAWPVSLALRVFGDAPIVPRLASFASLAWGFTALVRAIRERVTLSGWVVASVALATPALLFEARQIQPDAMATGMLALAAGTFLRAEAGRRRGLIVGGVAFGLAALAKAPVLLLAPVMGVFLLSRERSARARVSAFATLGFALVAVFVWRAWSDHLDHAFAADRSYFATGATLSDIARDLGRFESHKRFFGVVLPTYLVPVRLLPVAVFGVAIAFERSRQIGAGLVLWAFTWALFAVAFASRLYGHFYYALPLAVPLVLFVAFGIDGAWRALSARAEATRAERAAAIGLTLTLVTCAAFWPAASPDPFTSALSAIGRDGRGPTAGWLAPAFAVSFIVLVGVAIAASRLRVSRLWPVAVVAFALQAPSIAKDARAVLATRARFDDLARVERELTDLRPKVACYAPGRFDRVVTDYSGAPAGLYRADRPGFVSSAGDMDEPKIARLTSVGVRLYVHWLSAGPIRAKTPLRRLDGGAGFELLCLDDACRSACPASAAAQ